MLFPQSFIDDLKRQADIVRIIQDYVPLKKKGANWSACCPFHQEKTPSFSVNPAKEIYYCFGCAKGGSVFNFVMEIEHVSFPEAIKLVAERSHVPLPVLEEDKGYEARQRDAEEVIKLNSLALEWWERQLQADTPEAKRARDYIAGRGISDETREKFRLGFAPDRWDALLNHLKENGADAEQLEKSGLVIKKDTGGFYDRFRGRLMFPVLDARGRAVAFGGRTMSLEGEPKYLNSPETAAYIKGRHLYGLFQNREEIRRKKFVILVEGYLDLIIPYQHGVRNMVASLGTALTDSQAKLLNRHATRAVINYDGDKAGIKAALRAIEILLAENFELKVLALPDGADPDEFIRANGVEAYNQRRGAAESFIQFVLQQAAREKNLANPAEKAAAVEEVLPFLRAVSNPVQQRGYFDIAMDGLRIDDAGLRQDLWQTIRKTAPRMSNHNFGGDSRGDIYESRPRAENRTDSPADVRQKIARAVVKPTLAEECLLELILHDTQLRQTVLPHLEPADYEDLATAEIFRALFALEDEGIELSADALLARTQEDATAQEILPPLLMGEAQRAEGEALDDSLAAAQRCMITLRGMGIDRHLSALNTEMNAAERAGDAETRNRLSLEYLQWARAKKELETGRQTSA